MKFLVGWLLVVLGSGTCTTQVRAIDFARLRLNQLGFTSSKAQLTQLLGKPLATVNPHYECGEYASRAGGEAFYQLRYRQAVFIGNAKRGYELKSFRFAPAGPARLTYGGRQLSAATTPTQLTRLLSSAKTFKNKDGSVEIVVWEHDASAIFTFRAGKLVRYDFLGVGC